jgi:catechol 2,3-dioxygenase-like lactoylglutathione lyase family enzyme
MSLKIDMVGIVVHDMAAALAFYRQLGLAVPSGAEAEDHVEVITPNGYRIAWDTVTMAKSLDPNWVEPTGHAIGLAFKCDTPAEVDATYAALMGQRYATVLDPDGNAVDLFAPLS